MQLPKLRYLAPKSADELAVVLAEHGERARIIAGGTDVIGAIQDKLIQADYLVDINGIDELTGISYDKEKGLVLGGATKMEDIANSPIVKDKYYSLYQAIRQIGSPQIRAMASIAGNSCNASPCADTPPPLVTFDAKVTLASKRGKREIPLADFIQGNRKVDRAGDEYLECFTVPAPWPRSACRFSTITLRAAVEIDVASIAVNVALGSGNKIDQIRISMGSVAPTPMRAVKAEQILLGNEPTDELIEQAAKSCSLECKPIDDLRASAAYRKEVIRVIAAKTIREAVEAVQ